MRKENLINVNATRSSQATGTNGRSTRLQEIKLSETVWPAVAPTPAWYERFLPHREQRLMSEQSKGGIFVPYPLLAILMPAMLLILGGIITLLVMVNQSQNDLRRLEGRIELRETYDRDNREKLVGLQRDYEFLKREADRVAEENRRKGRN